MAPLPTSGRPTTPQQRHWITVASSFRGHRALQCRSERPCRPATGPPRSVAAAFPTRALGLMLEANGHGRERMVCVGVSRAGVGHGPFLQRHMRRYPQPSHCCCRRRRLRRPARRRRQRDRRGRVPQCAATRCERARAGGMRCSCDAEGLRATAGATCAVPKRAIPPLPQRVGGGGGGGVERAAGTHEL